MMIHAGDDLYMKRVCILYISLIHAYTTLIQALTAMFLIIAIKAFPHIDKGGLRVVSFEFALCIATGQHLIYLHRHKLSVL